jgi:hypothetical protein
LAVIFTSAVIADGSAEQAKVRNTTAITRKGSSSGGVTKYFPSKGWRGSLQTQLL